MPHINRITVKNVRSHKTTDITLSKNTTVVTGSNGAGKTSLIEAIYIACRGTSFKGSDKDILNNESEWYRIDMYIDDNVTTVKFDSTKATKKKQFSVDGKVSYRLPAKSKLPLVLFEPDDLRLIHGSPSRRRGFIDHFISQLDFAYSGILRRYEKAVKQRNSLLQLDYVDLDELFAWDIMLSDYGSEIISRRIENIALLNKTLGKIYNSISNMPAEVSIEYSVHGDDYTRQSYLNQLNTNRSKDLILKSTSIGPHRHDIVFNYNNKHANGIVSRGEARTIILALKLSEVEVIKSTTNKAPIILLDDVFSELDSERQLSLSTLDSECQIVITSAHTPENLNVEQIKLDSDS